jgi:hypothetical protein
MLTYNDISAKTNKHIVPALIDNVYKASPVLVKIRSNNQERFEGGLSIRHGIMYAELKGGAFGRGQTFDTSYVTTDTALEVNIKFYYTNITLYGTDNVLARGPEAAMSHVQSKMFNASGKMAKLLAQAFYGDGQGTVTSPIELDGFAASVDDGTNYAQYGGITRSDIGTGANTGINAYYQGGVNTFALSNLQTAFGATWFGAEHVDLIACPQPQWDAIWNKIQPQQRFMDESSDVAKVGFQSLRFNGVPVVVDQYCPAGKIWGLNTKYIYLYVSTLPKYQFGFTGWKESANTDDVTGQYLFAGNLLNVAPRLMFQVSGLTN